VLGRRIQKFAVGQQKQKPQQSGHVPIRVVRFPSRSRLPGAAHFSREPIPPGEASPHLGSRALALLPALPCVWFVGGPWSLGLAGPHGWWRMSRRIYNEQEER